MSEAHGPPRLLLPPPSRAGSVVHTDQARLTPLGTRFSWSSPRCPCLSWPDGHPCGAHPSETCSMKRAECTPTKFTPFLPHSSVASPMALCPRLLVGSRALGYSAVFARRMRNASKILLHARKPCASISGRQHARPFRGPLPLARGLSFRVEPMVAADLDIVEMFGSGVHRVATLTRLCHPSSARTVVRNRSCSQHRLKRSGSGLGTRRSHGRSFSPLPSRIGALATNGVSMRPAMFGAGLRALDHALSKFGGHARSPCSRQRRKFRASVSSGACARVSDEDTALTRTHQRQSLGIRAGLLRTARRHSGNGPHANRGLCSPDNVQMSPS